MGKDYRYNTKTRFSVFLSLSLSWLRLFVFMATRLRKQNKKRAVV
jgi:hypothetical protein